MQHQEPINVSGRLQTVRQKEEQPVDSPGEDRSEPETVSEGESVAAPATPKPKSPKPSAKSRVSASVSTSSSADKGKKHSGRSSQRAAHPEPRSASTESEEKPPRKKRLGSLARLRTAMERPE